MKIMILLGILLTSTTPSKYTIDFGEQKDGQDWMIVNDGVMGGLSESKAQLRENSLFFEGHISLENNGGFASIRSMKSSYDLSKYEKVKIRFRSKGRNFTLRFALSELYYKPAFKHEFSSTSDDWESIELNLVDFKEYSMGQETGNRINQEELQKVIRIGIMLFDKQEGSFELEIDSIEFY